MVPNGLLAPTDEYRKSRGNNIHGEGPNWARVRIDSWLSTLTECKVLFQLLKESNDVRYRELDPVYPPNDGTFPMDTGAASEAASEDLEAMRTDSESMPAASVPTAPVPGKYA